MNIVCPYCKYSFNEKKPNNGYNYLVWCTCGKSHYYIDTCIFTIRIYIDNELYSIVSDPKNNNYCMIACDLFITERIDYKIINKTLEELKQFTIQHRNRQLKLANLK